MKFKYPFIKPVFPTSQEIASDFEKIVQLNWFTNFGPYEKQLSENAAKYIGEETFATTVANCTDGLEIAINELFVNGSKNVIMPSFTFVAGAEALIKNGLTPVFIDINEKSWQPNIDQARFILNEENSDIAGILLCNIFGVGNTEIELWEDLAKEYQLPLIIDTAAGFGSSYTEGNIVGSRGDCEVFSLHATKPFSVGEGGLITSRNKELIEVFRSAQNFGFEGDRIVHRIGTNAKMQELSCAIGVRQLEKLEDKVRKRQNRFALYKSLLEPYGFTFQENAELSTIAFVSVIAPQEINVDELVNKLHNAGIEARRYYTPALHKMDVIAHYSILSKNSLEQTEKLCDKIISLPLYEDMSNSDVEYISNAVISN